MKYPGKGSGGPRGSVRRLRVVAILAVLSGLLALATVQTAVTAASVPGEGSQLSPQTTPPDLAYLPPKSPAITSSTARLTECHRVSLAEPMSARNSSRLGSRSLNTSTTEGLPCIRASLMASPNSPFL